MTALADGFHDVPPGKLATVTTYLEMTAPPAAGVSPLPPGVRIARVAEPDIGWYRALFRRIGAPWLWFSRLAETDDGLAAILRDPACLVLALTRDDVDVGLAEVSFRKAGEAEIVYFGLAPDATGGGLGRLLMEAALREAWRPGVSRVWLHTCDLDDPRAVGFYRRMGYVAYARKVEVADDPRLVGLLPRDCAPHILLLDPEPQRRRTPESPRT